MENELHPHRHSYRILILVLFGAFAAITIAVIFQYQRMGLIQKPEAVATNISSQLALPTEKTQISPTGVLKPIQKGEKQQMFEVQTTQTGSITRGMPITLNIIGNSQNQPVLGYDVVLSMPKKDYELVDVKSTLSEFTVMKFIKEDHLTITAILKPSVSRVMLLTGQPIVEITLKPLTSGPFKVQVKAELGMESSKIVTAQNGNDVVKLPASDSRILSLDIK